MYTDINIYIYMYIYVCVRVCMYNSCICVHLYIHLYIYISIHLYICGCVCGWACGYRWACVSYLSPSVKFLDTHLFYNFRELINTLLSIKFYNIKHDTMAISESIKDDYNHTRELLVWNVYN